MGPRAGARAAALALAIVALGGGAWLAAGILAGGAFTIPFPFFNGGGDGNPLSNGQVSVVGSIGQGAATPMTGGLFQVDSCVGGCIVPSYILAQPSLDSAHAFPTPFKPSLGHDRITFRGLTAHATIRIFTLSGELVTTLSKDDPLSGDLAWYPVVNSAGEPLASGVYFYVIEGDPGRAKGKLMVIK